MSKEKETKDSNPKPPGTKASNPEPPGTRPEPLGTRVVKEGLDFRWGKKEKKETSS